MKTSTTWATTPSPHPQSPSARSRLKVMLLLVVGFLAASLAAFAESGSTGAEPSDTLSEPTEAAATKTVGGTMAAETSTEATKTEEPANTSSGLWIFIDPETGERVARPTEEQRVRLRKFATPLNKSDQGLEPFELEGGGRGVRLNGRFQHAMIATVRPDGTIGFHCTDQSHDHPESAPPAAETSPTPVASTDSAVEQ